MKRVLILAATVLPLAGCQSILNLRDTLADPKTAQALAVAKGWAQVATCQIANIATVATKIEQAVNANKAALDTTGRVYTISAIVCQSFGGTVTSLEAVK